MSGNPKTKGKEEDELFVEFLVHGHELGVGSLFDIVPRLGVSMSVPNDVLRIATQFINSSIPAFLLARE